MRTLLILGFFICIYLHFQGQRPEVQHHDSLSTTQSSLKSLPQNKAKLPVIEHVQNNSPAPASVSYAAPESDQMISEADVEQDYDEDDLSQLPWDDIEEGWKSHLKEFLVSVDPEKADEMFKAYLEEKKKYVERVDFTDQDATAITETKVEDNDEGELERTHADNLKEIFGDNYSKVESLHHEYVESVQYLNRSSVKFSISL